MARVEIYTKLFCGYCARAKMLLAEKGVAFEEVYDLFAIRIIVDSSYEKEKAPFRRFDGNTNCQTQSDRSQKKC